MSQQDANGERNRNAHQQMRRTKHYPRPNQKKSWPSFERIDYSFVVSKGAPKTEQGENTEAGEGEEDGLEGWDVN